MATYVLTFEGREIARHHTPVYWHEDLAGSQCQTCAKSIGTTFYDMKTKKSHFPFNNAWAIMCPGCALSEDGAGAGVCGIGLGQRYDRQQDGAWLLTDGQD